MASSNSPKIEVPFAFERDTKNTIRFAEMVESDFAAPKLGQLYVPKSTLGELGFKEGDNLKITIEIA